MKKSQAEIMADIAEHRSKEIQETTRFLSIQVKIWRGLSIIHAHHPELTKESWLQMAIGGMLVGDLDRLERCQTRIQEAAARCGRTLGVFADEGPKCEGLSSASIWRESSKVAAEG